MRRLDLSERVGILAAVAGVGLPEQKIPTVIGSAVEHETDPYGVTTGA